MDYEWMEQRLRRFIEASTRVRTGSPARSTTRLPFDQLVQQTETVAAILRAVYPGSSISMDISTLRLLAQRAVGFLQDQHELAKRLGPPPGPQLAADALHPDVWDSAQSLYRNGHYREAVAAAARGVNARLQTKVGRRDEGETKLVGECFSLKPPELNKPRLRLSDDDGSDTFRSVHEGAAAFGRGCFLAIRNVLAHEHGEHAEPAQQEALEYLASFSVLARWVDSASVVLAAPEDSLQSGASQP